MKPVSKTTTKKQCSCAVNRNTLWRGELHFISPDRRLINSHSAQSQARHCLRKASFLVEVLGPASYIGPAHVGQPATAAGPSTEPRH